MIDATRQTYFSPADKTTEAYLRFLDTAKVKVRIAIYSFNMDAIVTKLIDLHKRGVDVALVLDRSQAAGTASERTEVAKLQAAGVPLVIGTSDHHQIMHSKFTVIDDEWTQSGSWNYTNRASDQDNFFDIEHNPERAAAFTATWEKMWLWITVHPSRRPRAKKRVFGWG